MNYKQPQRIRNIQSKSIFLLCLLVTTGCINQVSLTRTIELIETRIQESSAEIKDKEVQEDEHCGDCGFTFTKEKDKYKKYRSEKEITLREYVRHLWTSRDDKDEL